MTLSPDFLFELKKRFTGDLRLDSASKALYATDASIYRIEPLGVAIPKTQDDLISAVELAAKYKIPILPRGAGSSLDGQAVGAALILDCSRYLDSLIGIDAEAHTAIIEPGVVLARLNRAAAKHGLMYGPDPASAERATMGGIIGNNSTGAHSILYGMTADHIISADVILGDGSLETWDENGKSKLSVVTQQIREKYADAVKKNFPRSWRNSAGYRINYLLPWSPSTPPQWDENNFGMRSSVYRPQGNSVNMAQLLAGSEGTLAVMRRATVNLVPKPKHTILGVFAYATVAEACDDVPRLLECKPSAIELIPQTIIRLARTSLAFANQMNWIVGDPAAVFVIEFSGDQPQALKDAIRKLPLHSRDGKISTKLLTIAETPEDQSRIWNFRKVGLGILDSRPSPARPAAFIEDCAVPVERLGDFVREMERIMREHNTEGGIYAHASGGCLHIRPILDLQRGEGVRALRSMSEQTVKLVLSLGGSMSSEHGDGISAGEYIEKTYGAEICEAIRLIKKTADPHNLMNPEKMLDAPPMDTHLRFGESYKANVWNSALHFNHERGFAGAIEQCNGQGVCRKSGGVMCPSFQATRDEGNSTRGRANLLRTLMEERGSQGSGLHVDRLKVEDVYASLDLCLACKGCTAECPSGVDMPKLKYEFMHEYYKSHRRPIRDYLFGYFHLVSKWLRPVAPLANVFMKLRWSQKLIGFSAGITNKREFPQFKSLRADKKNVIGVKQSNKKNVLFLSDVFSRYLEPEVEQAAVEVLNELGYSVKKLSIVGAGASLLSKGFIEAAKKHASNVLDEIKRLDGGAGLSVIGCEPPEIYMLKHEYAALLPNRIAEIKSITKNVWLVDEFILRVVEKSKEKEKEENENSTGRVAQSMFPHVLQSPSKEKPAVTFHPHCHQRAEGLAGDGLPSGVSATVEMLKTFGYEVETIDAGCCGMAGTFGYDAEHYDLSMQVGELGVLPKFREMGMRNGEKGTVAASTGSACRIQIRQGAGVEAVHPLMLVRDALKSAHE